MLREMIAFLDDFLNRHGTPAVAKAVVGVMSFAVLLGALLGSTAIKAGALVATILLFTSAGIALIADRRSDRRELENHRKLVWHYCKLKNDQDSAFHIVDWNETFTINERGDAHEKVKVQIRPLHADLWFICLLFSCGWPQPARFRRKVKTSVRRTLVDGSMGTSLPTTSTWRSDGKMDVTIHLSEPPVQESVLSIEVDVTWPGRCAPLMNGSPERFSVRFKQPVEHARFRIIGPPGATTYSEPLPTRSDDTRYLLTMMADDSGREQITFEAFDLPPQNTVGVRLEIKEKLRRAFSADGA